MNAKLNDRLNGNWNGKSLACWFLIAASCPQVLAIAPSHAQNATQSPISANQTDVVAVASRITDINTDVAGDRLNLTLNFASSDRPQVTYTKQGKSWVAVLNGAQLQLGNGNASYAKANPAPGITAIEATQYAANKVQIRVTTNNPELLKDLIKRQDTADSLVFSLEMQPSATQASTISGANSSEAGVINSQNASNSDRVLIAQNTTSSSVGKPLFEPKVTIIAADGKTRVAQSTAPNSVPPPVANPVTPQLPGRVPGVVPPFRQIKTPPVGDIATTTSKLRADIVELGTAERVPRITLRDAPAIEVLTLIGRVAGLSVVSADAPSTTGTAAPAANADAATGLKQPVSLSIENETAQDVFNNVLRITGLEANRIGNTVFVATRLPLTLKNLTTKTYRLNQINATEATNFLASLGAGKSTVATVTVRSVQAQTAGAGVAATQSDTTSTTTTSETATITSIENKDFSMPLKGLVAIAEARTNAVTLVGSPSQVAYAESQLARIDIRKRQVSVNVRIVDVRLGNSQSFSSGFGFDTGAGGTQTTINAGAPNPGIAAAVAGAGTVTTGALTIDFNNPIASLGFAPQAILARLQASITNNQAKILTDPTLTVQEGESASITLSEEVVSRITTQISTSTPPVTTIQPELKEFGLFLNIKVDRIDDNGFISLSVAPTVSSPLSPVSSGGTLIATPISKRSLVSGQIRMRDGQTLFLSGVIRDSDRNVTSKIPILGDLPIIGALFRSTLDINDRSEVIIVVTPRIIDDSQDANWGYTYQPNPETQKVLDSNQRKVQ
ncbi:MAG: secretin N-terminal domain-containing protein [Pseudanabaena sp.]